VVLALSKGEAKILGATQKDPRVTPCPNCVVSERVEEFEITREILSGARVLGVRKKKKVEE
jgi:hypothetical protein